MYIIVVSIEKKTEMLISESEYSELASVSVSGSVVSYSSNFLIVFSF